MKYIYYQMHISLCGVEPTPSLNRDFGERPGATNV